MDEAGLGRRVQQARQAAGLTQQALCQKAGLSYSTLTKIERGAIKSPSIFTIQTIAAALGTSLDALLLNATSPAQQKPAKYRSKSGVSFVYFDINGCLVRFFHRAFTHLSEQSGLPPDLIESTFWHYNDQVCRGKMTVAEFNKTLANQLQLPAVDWLAEYLDAIEPIAETYELLQWVAEHYRIGLLTNIMPGFVEAMLKRGYLPNIAYHAIVDSSKTGAIKPEAAIYKIAEREAGCPADEILLIDDTRANLMAGATRKWHVLWFDDYRPTESVTRIREALEPAEQL
ncbi:MAG TPA: helix-turn-helix domain-containing protein [Candidatus Saccharimonadales bacterium]|nr:helix-turn-helix domain-containing protein [Candidatus Saccharimonadales bacterium]